MSTRRLVIDIVKGVAVAVPISIAAAVVGALVVRRVIAAPAGPAAPPPAMAPIADWQRYARGGERIGADTARVTIVEFSDFQCPFCNALQQELHDVIDRHPATVALVFHHYPIASLHPRALDAALAATCAGAQGRFAPFAALLFARQAELDRTSFAGLARQAGVGDAGRFERCLADSTTRRRVDADIALGNELRIRGTPTLIVAGRLVQGVPPTPVLDSLVDAALHQ